MAITEKSDTIHLSGQFSRQDHSQVSRLIIPLSKRIVVHGAVLLLVALVLSAFRPIPPRGPIAFVAFVALYFLIWWRLQRRRFSSQQANREHTHIEINNGGVLVRAVDQETRFAASVFKTVTRDDRFIVLRGREPGGLPIVVLPKSWCPTASDWSSVERIVATWFPLATSSFTTESARRVRREHLPAEIALKRSVLLLLALSLIITLVAFVVPFQAANANVPWLVIFFRVQSGIVTAVCFLVAWGVRRGAAWSRVPLQVLAYLCFPLFPIGTALGARILYLLMPGSEPRLLTTEYEQIVRVAGPMKLQDESHIRSVRWIAFMLACVVLIIGLVYLISLIPEDIRHNL
ncbi:hypothetical protein [Aporhodopirellula aestuarii]|uniref:Uncharacterized protein n=1 Tax=Aporhodopirellula aestuarii TaxID=2950107 RepID=A0ABT0TY10_9BACT|nr:hypothetical protein [Aporhodopirellula aestuarii]MCM2369479.1 hypothetical protein [Aporhodopirellula aestuarii]